jgi:hypothetical protein
LTSIDDPQPTYVPPTRDCAWIVNVWFLGLNVMFESVKPAVVQVAVAAVDCVPMKLGTLQGGGGGGPGGGPCETVIVVSGSTQSPGWLDGSDTCWITILVSFASGKNSPVNPASVHAVRAVATVTPRRFGTWMHVGEVVGPSGSTVTVMAEPKKRFGAAHASPLAGSVTDWDSTVLVSWPLAGLNSAA